MIVTPRVKEEVRAHFNCKLLEGAELEDQGEDGTALTHWEKRVFEVKFISCNDIWIYLTEKEEINKLEWIKISEREIFNKFDSFRRKKIPFF